MGVFYSVSQVIITIKNRMIHSTNSSTFPPIPVQYRTWFISETRKKNYKVSHYN